MGGCLQTKRLQSSASNPQEAAEGVIGKVHRCFGYQPVISLRFSLGVTFGREEMKRFMQFHRDPRRLPVVLSVEDVVDQLTAVLAPGLGQVNFANSFSPVGGPTLERFLPHRSDQIGRHLPADLAAQGFVVKEVDARQESTELQGAFAIAFPMSRS